MTGTPVSPLRQRMIEDMTIRKLAPRTQDHYIRTVKNFSAFLLRPPRRASRICAVISCIWSRTGQARPASIPV